MNRRDRQRMDDRRKESNAPPKKINCDLNSSGSSKSLMDNYFQSQKIIQSLTENPAAVNEVKVTKSFKIPKKQPAKSNIEPERFNAGIDKGSRSTNTRGQYSNRTSWNRSNTSNGGKGDDFNYPRRDLKNDRIEQNKRFDDERRRRDDVFTKKAFNDDSVDSSRPKREPHKGEDDRLRHSTDSKRIRLDSPTKRDRFRPPKTEVKSNDGYTSLEKTRLKNRLYFNQPIDIIIADRAAPNGKISPENAAIFLNEIKESVAKRILTDPTYQTKFIDHKHEDGLIRMTCADDFTTVFIQQKLTEELSLWPGAKLEWSFGHFKTCFINLVVPNSIAHISEFLDSCKKTDSRMQTEKWRRIECENAGDDSGKLFKLAIDKQSYEIMKQQGNLVRCGNLSIKINLDALNEISEQARQSN